MGVSTTGQGLGFLCGLSIYLHFVLPCSISAQEPTVLSGERPLHPGIDLFEDIPSLPVEEVVTEKDTKIDVEVQLVAFGLFREAIRDTLINPGGKLLNLKSSEGNLSAIIDVHAAFTDDILLAASLIGSTPWGRDDDPTLDTLEYTLRYDSPSRLFYVSVGKRLIRWSQFTTFHHLDFLDPSEKYLGFLEEDPFENEGSLALTMSGLFKGITVTGIVAKPAKQTLSRRMLHYLIRMDFSLGDTDIGLYSEKAENRKLIIGGSTSKALTDQVVMVLEFLTTRGRDLRTAHLGQSRTPLGENIFLPQRYILAESSPRQRYKLLVGLRYAFKQSETVEVSYFLNSHGYTGSEWDGVVTGLQEARLGNAVRRTDAPFHTNAGNPYAAFVFSMATQLRNHYLRRHYLSLRLDSLYRFPSLPFSMGTVMNLEDGSANLFGNITYTPKSFLSINLSVNMSIGENTSEYGLTPAGLTFGTKIAFHL